MVGEDKRTRTVIFSVSSANSQGLTKCEFKLSSMDLNHLNLSDIIIAYM
jgi:hypothetical protein